MSLFGGSNQSQANNDQGAINQAGQNVQTSTNDLLGLFNQAGGLASLLQGLDTSQMQTLGNQEGAANQSSLASFMNQEGGLANPAAVFQGISRNNAQQDAQSTQAMQSQLAGQNLSANEAQYGLQSNILNSIMSGNTSYLSALQGNQNANQNQANQANQQGFSDIGAILGGFF